MPLPQLLEAGATVALGADDPLLFGSRLAAQYATMRAAHGLDDAQLAELARMSVRASRAPESDTRAWLADIDAWSARREWNDEPVTNPPDPWTPGSDDDLWRQNEEHIAPPEPTPR